MTKKLERILVISTMYPSKANPTFGIFVKNQVEELKKRGIQVDVAAIKDPRMGKLFVLKKYLLWIIRIIYILLTRGRSYDIIHAHYVFPSGWLALLFQKTFGTRVIVTAHGGDLDKMSRIGSFFFRQTEQVLHEADHVIAVGEKLKTDMVTAFKVKEEKITLLNMGVNRQVFTPMDQEQAKHLLDIAPSSKTILFVGNIIAAKGMTELVEAYSDLKDEYPNLELHLIGAQKEPPYVRWLKGKISNENTQDIKIHPPMKQRDIARWQAAADVFVIPSHMEGFGLVALEAMSCHTPVVGTNVGGLRYLLANNAGVLVEPKNKESLRIGIKSILKNDNFHKELIANGEEKAQKYDQEKQIEQLLELYHQE
ncbi:Glycosyltransferase involved in cell wall bisynthesis [Virgibacillus subterraneus]|uniref:Glycosyltransferase involved in cell wall bisynthesis n=1 Tax=Virgibacillus subterraneus TaxID=621109 RepID=A0A1H9AE37_9BACI|nr:glycosyltransferase [Virgibacillus subterraneus]SEP74930.1 Glycosyltransferase involved in cell wall bisynthesis [Virgibacillus subterraneus]